MSVYFVYFLSFLLCYIVSMVPSAILISFIDEAEPTLFDECCVANKGATILTFIPGINLISTGVVLAVWIVLYILHFIIAFICLIIKSLL